MLDKLKNFALEKGYALARAKGVKCPGCGVKLDLPAVMPKDGFDAFYDCKPCGWGGSLTEAIADRQGAPIVEEKPAHSKIEEAALDGGFSWLIPAKKGVSFLIVFGVFWLGMSSLMTYGFLFGDMTDAESGEPTSRWMILFFIPFLAIGIGVLYAGLRMRYTEVLIMIDAERVRMLKKFFGKVKEKSIARSEVGGVWLKESYQQNDRPVYEIYVEDMGSGKGLGFGSQLKEDEKSWLLGRLQSALPDADGGDDTAGAYGAAVVGEKKEFEIKGIKLEKVGDGFRVTKKTLAGKWLMMGGLFMATVAGIIGVNSMPDGVGFGWGLLFSAVPLVMVTLTALIGLGLVIGGIVMTGQESVFEFSDGALEVEKRRNGVMKSRARHERSDFNDVTCARSGAVNDEPRYRVVLKGKKGNVTLCGFVKPEIAGDLEAWLMGWLPGEAAVGGYGSAISLAPEKERTVRAGRRSAIYNGKKSQQLQGGMRYVFLMLPVVFMVAGGSILFFGVKNLMSANASEQWPQVTGTVESSEVKVNSDSDGTTYGAKVRYNYKVAGVAHSSDRVAFGEVNTSNRGRAETTVSHYPAGKKIQVFYDQAKPSESVLEPGVKGQTYFMPIFGSIFFAAGTFFLVLMLKKGKK